MDSISQMALGAAVGVAVMGRSVSPWRAATWGAVCGTLPDLDVLIDHGDAVRSMTLHRAETHALFFLSVASPVIAAAILGRCRLASAWEICHVVLGETGQPAGLRVTAGQAALPAADDPLAVIDIPHFCREDGHQLLSSQPTDGGHAFLIEKA